jgi:DNA-binding NarL/FixJ family response regulator
MNELLIVADDVDMGKAMVRVIRNDAISPALPDLWITVCSSPQEALDHARRSRVDVVVAAFGAHGMSGGTFLSRMRSLQPDVVRIVLGDVADGSGIDVAMPGAGFRTFVAAPEDEEDLKQAVASAFAVRGVIRESLRVADVGGYAIFEPDLALAAHTRGAAATPFMPMAWTNDGGILLV